MKKDEFLKVIDEASKKIAEVLMNKGADYSGDYDRLANMKLMSVITGDRPIIMSPLLSCLIRQLDKIQRAVNLLINGEAIISDEKMEDTLLDNIGYGYLDYAAWIDMKKDWKKRVFK